MRWAALPPILVAVACAGVAATTATATAKTSARSLAVATTGPTAPLATGLSDPVFLGPQASTAFAMAKQAGATYARIMVSWASIAPQTLPDHGFDPTDPNSHYYRWSPLDASVSAAQAAGITPILDIVAPPDWAYYVEPGTWTGGQPNVGDLGDFATALAAHYAGSVHAFSVWNEANYTKNLYPQDPTYYRSMVNAVADAVHGVDSANLALAGELAPFRNKPGTQDKNHPIPPLDFMRSMLCLSSTKPVHRTCNTPAEFDVWTHHPYSNSGPFGHAQVSGGVELGDLPRMKALLQMAQRLGAIASAQPVKLWVTEVGWSTNPPNKHGVPIRLETRWVAESMYQMWKSGVTLGTWFLLQDRPIHTAYESGLYFNSSSLADAQAKPLLPPFRFPFVAYLKPQGNVFVWGRDSTSDMQDVTIQQQNHAGGPWNNVATVTSNSYGIFQATLPLGAKKTYSLRASAPGSASSQAFSLTVPSNENMHVIPFPKS
jgi:hypothetical protein